jgi:hypothetical protein
MSWGSWFTIPPPLSDSKKKQWEDIPNKVFWAKITFLLFINAMIGLLIYLIINM